MRELIIGCGKDVKKQIIITQKEFDNVTSLDICERHSPDVLWDLNVLPLPFDDDLFDEIHAYEVLEHVGRQGDYKGFFKEFDEYARIMKNGGYFCGSVPKHTSIWAWGDPGHTRVLLPETFSFLDQDYYKNVGTCALSDYRDVYKSNFKLVLLQEQGERIFFAMQLSKGEKNGNYCKS